MKVLISAGEASGDRYGAELIREIERIQPGFGTYAAIGGKALQEAGAKLLADSSKWGAVGIIEALKVAPKVMRESKAMRRALSEMPPGIFVPIDFGALNVRLAKLAKEKGWKVLYFIPPGSWRRNKAGKDMATVTNAISTPFSWNAELLKEQGANAHWFGHPIKQLVGDVPIGRERHGLAILPGSRAQEVRLNLKVIAKVLKDWPEPVSFICAPSYPKAILEPLWTFVSGRSGDVFIEDGKYDALKASRLAIVCSGTATLEVALCGCPMVVLYKLSLLNHLQGFVMGLKGKSISLPNILLQRDAVPEFKGAAIDILALRAEIKRLWDAPDRQLAQLADLTAILGSNQAISDTANLVLSLQ